MATREFQYQEILPVGDEAPTPYRLLTPDHVSTFEAAGQTFLRVEPEALTLLTREAMRDIAHLLRPGHLAQLRNILDDPEASPNDRFVALELLKNANIAAGGVLPIVPGHRHRDRHGQEGPVRLHRRRRRGGASRAASSTTYTHGEPALLADGAARHVQGEEHRHQPARADRALRHRRRRLQVPVHGQGRRLGQQELPVPGDQGAPEPRQPAEVRRGQAAARSAPRRARPTTWRSSSAARRPSTRSRSAKLASARYLDTLPHRGQRARAAASATSSSRQKVLELAQRTGIGAQFGGKYFCHDVRVIRLPRHGASCPVGIAVSCSADRQALGKITKRRRLPRAARDRPGASTCPSRPTTTSAATWCRSI